MARKSRTRRFREARNLKRTFDDGLFPETDRTLADLYDQAQPDAQHSAAKPVTNARTPNDDPEPR